MKALLLSFALLLVGVGYSDALANSEIDATINATVADINRSAPIERGDWILTKASYRRATRTITYSLRDKTAVLSEISVEKYRSLAKVVLKKDACRRGPEFSKYGVTVIYAISDRSGKPITSTTIRMSAC